MKQLIPFVLLVVFNFYSCKTSKPHHALSNFQITNISNNKVNISFYTKHGYKYLDFDMTNNESFAKEYELFTNCCPHCLLSGSDSVVFFYNDSVKINHYMYDTNFPSNNIYKAMYFDIKDKYYEGNCEFEYFITNDDYLEALENSK